MMLIEPASKVSVPLTVVQRTVVKAKVKVDSPEAGNILAAEESLNKACPTQTLDPNNEKI